MKGQLITAAKTIQVNYKLILSQIEKPCLLGQSRLPEWVSEWEWLWLWTPEAAAAAATTCYCACKCTGCLSLIDCRVVPRSAQLPPPRCLNDPNACLPAAIATGLSVRRLSRSECADRLRSGSLPKCGVNCGVNPNAHQLMLPHLALSPWHIHFSRPSLFVVLSFLSFWYYCLNNYANDVDDKGPNDDGQNGDDYLWNVNCFHKLSHSVPQQRGNCCHQCAVFSFVSFSCECTLFFSRQHGESNHRSWNMDKRPSKSLPKHSSATKFKLNFRLFVFAVVCPHTDCAHKSVHFSQHWKNVFLFLKLQSKAGHYCQDKLCSKRF